MRRHGWLNIIILTLAVISLAVVTNVLWGGEESFIAAQMLSERHKKIQFNEGRITKANREIAKLEDYKKLRDALRMENGKLRGRLIVAKNDDEARLELKKILDRAAETAQLSLAYQPAQIALVTDIPAYPSVEVTINIDQPPVDKVFDFIYLVENAPVLISTIESNINSYRNVNKTMLNFRYRFQAYYSPPPEAVKAASEQKQNPKDNKDSKASAPKNNK